MDIPENKWYYVVLKTFNDRVTQELTILKLSDPKNNQEKEYHLE